MPIRKQLTVRFPDGTQFDVCVGTHIVDGVMSGDPEVIDGWRPHLFNWALQDARSRNLSVPDDLTPADLQFGPESTNTLGTAQGNPACTCQRPNGRCRVHDA